MEFQIKQTKLDDTKFCCQTVMCKNSLSSTIVKLTHMQWSDLFKKLSHKLIMVKTMNFFVCVIMLNTRTHYGWNWNPAAVYLTPQGLELDRCTFGVHIHVYRSRHLTLVGRSSTNLN